MKSIERIKKNIESDKEIMKRINKNRYYDINDLIYDIRTYIKAVSSGRIKYDVISVSRSGMSRTIKIMSCEKSDKNNYYYRNYRAMLEILGEKSCEFDTIRVGGCGMNMLFATNYNIIGIARGLGFISEIERRTLEQKVN